MYLYILKYLYVGGFWISYFHIISDELCCGHFRTRTLYMFLVSHVRAYCQFYLVSYMGFPNFGISNVLFKVSRHKLLLSWRRTYLAYYADNSTGVTYTYLINSKYLLAFCCHAAFLSYFTTIYNTVQYLVYILISTVETSWNIFETALTASCKSVQLWRYSFWLARPSCILPAFIYVACDRRQGNVTCCIVVSFPLY